MTPIYNASTLARVTANARMAEYNRIKSNFVPEAIRKINEANFAAADAGLQSAITLFNLLCMELTTEEKQNYFRDGLKSELKELGFELKIELYHDVMRVTCKW